MKKYLVIGKPISHSLSPDLHNFWIENYNLNSKYEKKEVTKDQIKTLIEDIKIEKIHGVNVTVPYKQEIISYIDSLTPEANITQSVNTIYLNDNKIVGHNTDIEGFEMSIKKKYEVKNKQVLILGSGGVVPSIIFALNRMKVSKINICNRTKEKADNLKKIFPYVSVVDWGTIPHFDIVINATSLGLNKKDVISLDLFKSNHNKLFYDVIYNPSETNFLKDAKKFGHQTENGMMMFIYQARAAFKIWHKIEPLINNKTLKICSK